MNLQSHSSSILTSKNSKQTSFDSAFSKLNPSELSSFNENKYSTNLQIADLVEFSKGDLRYQKRVFVGFCLAQILVGMVTVSMIFFFYSVSFECKQLLGCMSCIAISI